MFEKSITILRSVALYSADEVSRLLAAITSAMSTVISTTTTTSAAAAITSTGTTTSGPTIITAATDSAALAADLSALDLFFVTLSLLLMACIFHALFIVCDTHLVPGN